MSSHFDFRQPFSDSNAEFEKVAQKTDEFVQSSMESKQQTQSSSSSSNVTTMLVGVLMISLVALGTYALYQQREYNDTLASLQPRGQVAGVNEGSVASSDVFSGDQFSIVSPLQKPRDFVDSRSVGQSRFLPDLTAIENQLIAIHTKNGTDSRSGIVVEVSEYDNKLNRSDFSDIVVSTLGGVYKVTASDITSNNGFTYTKIESEQKIYEDVYVTVTEDNYYVITIFTETKDSADFKDVNAYTDTILNSLYLN